MLDANGDVRDGEVAQMFCESSMQEVLLEIDSDLPATSTFNRNFQDILIDGVFATPLVQLQAGGYFAFGQGPGKDHRCLWFDISYQCAFGLSAPILGQFQALRLTCKDPRVRQRYTDLYRPFVQQHCLDVRSYNLQESSTGSLDKIQVKEYEVISTLRSQ
jgi:hypothetical protein